MKATRLLRDQHQSLERLVGALLAEEEPRLPLLLELVEQLMAHLAIEEHFFYDGLCDDLGIEVERFEEAHAKLRSVLMQIALAELDDDTLRTRMLELAALLRAHTRDYERDLLPLVESRTADVALEVLGARIETFWGATTTAPLSTRPTGTDDGE
jgi:hypothetical protein